ncbi:MAG TPA: hemerythrin domain-containing protein [Pyrinomonadaceae bacterium]|nr:hemerythrin domain-containing protein [Pyrinomonadaceae bacterium]
MNKNRRQLLTGISLAGAGFVLNGCRATQKGTGGATNEEHKDERPKPGEATEVEVTAAEDLMREHGILRRALLVYQESAVRLRQDAASVPPDALEKTANLFRVFGEDYHEKSLEEVYIFPTLKKSTNAAASYVDILLAQHMRGREITEYMLSITKADKIPSNSVESLAKALESFVRMYEHHAAIEDTVIFPAWKAVVGDAEYDQLGEKFEEIETEQFGGDGFETALKRMAEIETSLGLSNLDMFTAPPPPATK